MVFKKQRFINKLRKSVKDYNTMETLFALQRIRKRDSASVRLSLGFLRKRPIVTREASAISRATACCSKESL